MEKRGGAHLGDALQKRLYLKHIEALAKRVSSPNDSIRHPEYCHSARSEA